MLISITLAAVFFVAFIIITKIRFMNYVYNVELIPQGHSVNSDPYMVEKYGKTERYEATFYNGMGISVLEGRAFYSRPDEGTFEIAMIGIDNQLVHDNDIFPMTVEGWVPMPKVRQYMFDIARHNPIAS